MLKIVKKIITRYQQFVGHPLVQNPLVGLIKYIYINLIMRVCNKPIKIKWLNNLRYYLSLGDSGIIGNYYFFIDDYEESIFIIHYLTDKDLFIDVGSNHGHYTMISSGICYSKSIIYSLFFGSNFYFHYASQQYGAESSLYIPFLHTWTLSIEEQYYLLFPVILILLGMMH